MYRIVICNRSPNTHIRSLVDLMHIFQKASIRKKRKKLSQKRRWIQEMTWKDRLVKPMHEKCEPIAMPLFGFCLFSHSLRMCRKYMELRWSKANNASYGTAVSITQRTIEMCKRSNRYNFWNREQYLHFERREFIRENMKKKKRMKKYLKCKKNRKRNKTETKSNRKKVKKKRKISRKGAKCTWRMQKIGILLRFDECLVSFYSFLTGMSLKSPNFNHFLNAKENEFIILLKKVMFSFDLGHIYLENKTIEPKLHSNWTS